PHGLECACDPGGGNVMWREARDRPAIEANCAGGDTDEAGNRIEECGLARAVGSEHADACAGRRRECETRKCLDTLEAHTKGFKLEHYRASATLAGCG